MPEAALRRGDVVGSLLVVEAVLVVSPEVEREVVEDSRHADEEVSAAEVVDRWLKDFIAAMAFSYFPRMWAGSHGVTVDV